MNNIIEEIQKEVLKETGNEEARICLINKWKLEDPRLACHVPEGIWNVAGNERPVRAKAINLARLYCPRGKNISENAMAPMIAYRLH